MRDLLRRKTEAATEQALHDGGALSAEEIAELDRLARLVEIQGQVDGQPRRARWPIAALFVVTLGAVSALMFVRMPETGVTIDLKVDEVGLVVPRSQTLSGAIAAREMAAWGVASVLVPRRTEPDGRVREETEAPWRDVTLSVAPSADGRLTLNPLTLPAGTRIWLGKKDGAPGQLGLSLQHDDLDIALTLKGRLVLSTGAAAKIEGNFGRGRSMELRGRHEVLGMSMTPRDPARLPFARSIAISELHLVRTHQDAAAAGQIEESTIRSGQIRFNALDRKPRILGTGETIRIAAPTGQIRGLSYDGEHVAFAFHGRVSELTTGEKGARRSLMPSLLEWLSAQHALSLFWGVAMYIFGLAVALMRWWRIAV